MLRSRDRKEARCRTALIYLATSAKVQTSLHEDSLMHISDLCAFLCVHINKNVESRTLAAQVVELLAPKFPMKLGIFRTLGFSHPTASLQSHSYAPNKSYVGPHAKLCGDRPEMRAEPYAGRQAGPCLP